MGLKKTISKDGGASHKVIIDRAIMELLGWQAGTVLDITTDGICLVLRADGVDASGGLIGVRSRATVKRKTKEIKEAISENENASS